MNGGDPAGGKAAGAATGVPHAVFAIDGAVGAAPRVASEVPRPVLRTRHTGNTDSKQCRDE
jgi:hypothetical protein